MIPKIIHYCWFGRNPKPKLTEKCIKSWKKYCPGYQIVEWNEDTFDLSTAPLYVRQAYESKKWAFVTDWVRLKVVYDHGGIYLDTDVELIKSPEELLKYNAFFGFEKSGYIATGLGFGAVKYTPILEELMADYDTASFFSSDGHFDLLPCPVRNTDVLTRHSLKLNGTTQTLPGNIQVLSSEWLCPYKDWDGENSITKHTVSIHWYSASWESEDYHKKKNAATKKNTKLRRKRLVKDVLHNIFHIPNRVLRFLLGEDKYSSLKLRLTGGHKGDS